MPRFLERDEASAANRAALRLGWRREVRPFGAMEKNIVEGFIKYAGHHRRNLSD